MNDLYLMLLPVCILLFAWIVRIERPILSLWTRLLRRYSVVIFMSHIAVLQVFKSLIGDKVFYNVPVFVVTVVMSILFYYVLSDLARIPGFNFLKRAY